MGCEIDGVSVSSMTPRISVEMFRDGINTVDTNQAAALRFFKNLPYVASQLVDLSAYSRVRLHD